ncbi:MAG: mitotic checkpoint protein-like protein BUB3 [Olpidium bornovanus]|uniref:Mitotic checkpoint protein-like protein BUB3 n=1 Tax=Olpidium bornovanus TaxID=278681 RepID=A0A8H7ZSK6_9FUNG|nr:MAG: mitotic checkpoint protein-like protein BUB3 [Olpidium bornovanus]
MASAAFDELNDPPEDAISSLEYHPLEPSVLLVASWDKTARVYDTSANRLETKVTHAAPVLDACFVGADGARAASVGVDRGVRMITITLHTVASLGANLTSEQSQDAFALKFQTRALRCMPNGAGEPEQDRQLSSDYAICRHESVSCSVRILRYAMSSIEGRIAIEYFDYSRESQAHRYAFKCHRETVDGVQMVYPINALAFNQLRSKTLKTELHGTLASGGADGLVNVWDSVSRRRVRQFRKFETGVSALSFNCSGEQIAVGCSYTWEQGDKP